MPTKPLKFLILFILMFNPAKLIWVVLISDIKYLVHLHLLVTVLRRLMYAYHKALQDMNLVVLIQLRTLVHVVKTELLENTSLSTQKQFTKICGIELKLMSKIHLSIKQQTKIQMKVAFKFICILDNPMSTIIMKKKLIFHPNFKLIN
jgi:hypothetical protein